MKFSFICPENEFTARGANLLTSPSEMRVCCCLADKQSLDAWLDLAGQRATPGHMDQKIFVGCPIAELQDYLFIVFVNTHCRQTSIKLVCEMCHSIPTRWKRHYSLWICQLLVCANLAWSNGLTPSHQWRLTMGVFRFPLLPVCMISEVCRGGQWHKEDIISASKVPGCKFGEASYCWCPTLSHFCITPAVMWLWNPCTLSRNFKNSSALHLWMRYCWYYFLLRQLYIAKIHQFLLLLLLS